MKKPLSDIGRRLRELQETKSISSRKMALAIGVDPSQFLKIEKGDLNLTQGMVEGLSSQYGISIDWLYNGKGEMLKSGGKGAPPPATALIPEYIIQEIISTKNELIQAHKDAAAREREIIDRLTPILANWDETQAEIRDIKLNQAGLIKGMATVTEFLSGVSGSTVLVKAPPKDTKKGNPNT